MSLVYLWYLAPCSLPSFHALASCGMKSLIDSDLSGLALLRGAVGKRPCRAKFKSGAATATERAGAV